MDPTKKHATRLGRLGEALARDYLLARGHRLLHANLRLGHLEIDLITLDRGTLVIVEVKAMTSYRYGYPECQIGAAKQRRLKDAALSFCHANPAFYELPIRFDVVGLLVRQGRLMEILHIRDAFC